MVQHEQFNNLDFPFDALWMPSNRFSPQRFMVLASYVTMYLAYMFVGVCAVREDGVRVRAKFSRNPILNDLNWCGCNSAKGLTTILSTSNLEIYSVDVSFIRYAMSTNVQCPTWHDDYRNTWIVSGIYVHFDFIVSMCALWRLRFRQEVSVFLCA